MDLLTVQKESHDNMAEGMAVAKQAGDLSSS